MSPLSLPSKRSALLLLPALLAAAACDRSRGATEPIPVVGTNPMLGRLNADCPARCGHVLETGLGKAVASEINEAGQVAGTFGWTIQRGSRAFIWSKERGARELLGLGGENYVMGMNDAGQVVGYSVTLDASGNAVAPWPVVWEPDGKLFQLRGPGGDYLRGRAWAINNDAVIVGEVEAPQQPAGVSQTAFRWSLRDGMTLLPSLGGFASVAYDVNRSGQVVGKSQTQAGATRAFLWTADGGVRDLGALPGHQHSEAVAINDKGWVVGFSYSEGDFYGGRAFLWTPERGMESFNPNGFFYATDVNHWGEVTGWGYDETGARTGLVWHRENGLLALEKLGRAFSHAYAINSWGDVAGTLDNQAMDDRAPAVWTWAGNEGRYKP